MRLQDSEVKSFISSSLPSDIRVNVQSVVLLQKAPIETCSNKALCKGRLN